MTYELLLALFLALSPYLDNGTGSAAKPIFELSPEEAVSEARNTCRTLIKSPAVTLLGVPVGQFLDEMIGSVPLEEVGGLFAEDFRPKLAKLGLDYDQAIRFYLSICHTNPSDQYLADRAQLEKSLQTLNQTRQEILAFLAKYPRGGRAGKRVSRYHNQFRLGNGEVVYDSTESGDVWLPLDKIPLKLQQALVAVEDKLFYQHKGIDITSLIRAANKSLEGNYQGGSTLTQQLVKNLYYFKQENDPAQPNPRLRRKLGELIIARELELSWGKPAILEAYFNTINFGRGPKGVGAAALYLFDKPLSELGLRELATLAAMPKRPGAYPHHKYFEELKERQHYVLEQMRQEGYIKEDEVKANLLIDYPFTEKRSAVRHISPYSHYIRNALKDPWFDYYRQDFAVQATLSLHPGLQELAQQALVDGLLRYEQRFTGTRDPEGVPRVQGAVVIMDNRTGDVLALQGGPPKVRLKDKVVTNEYDRASRDFRQPGSTMKPFTYLMALANGLTPTDRIPDYGIELPLLSPFGQPWQVKNYGGAGGGSHSLRYGLEHSRNLMTAWLLEMATVGGYFDYNDAFSSNPGRALDEVRRLSVEFGVYCSDEETRRGECPDAMGPPQRHYPLILGAQETSLLRMVTAYARIANGGVPIQPRFIKHFELASEGDNRRVNSVDNPLNDNAQHRRVNVDARSLFQLKSLLTGVTQRGTAARLARFGDRVAGKTGTTDDYRDAWFIGFTESLTIGVWVGHPDRHTLGSGATGGAVALPIFETILGDILEGKPQRPYLAQFPAYDQHGSLLASPPHGLLAMAVDPGRGCIQNDLTLNSLIEYVKEENSYVQYENYCDYDYGYPDASAYASQPYESSIEESLGGPFGFNFGTPNQEEAWRPKRSEGHFGSSSWIMGDR